MTAWITAASSTSAGRVITGASSTWGLGNVAIALAALRELVFEQSTSAVPNSGRALQNNYQGYDALRQRINHCPRYGNDDPRGRTRPRPGRIPVQ